MSKTEWEYIKELSRLNNTEKDQNLLNEKIKEVLEELKELKIEKENIYDILLYMYQITEENIKKDIVFTKRVSNLNQNSFTNQLRQNFLKLKIEELEK